MITLPGDALGGDPLAAEAAETRNPRELRAVNFAGWLFDAREFEPPAEPPDADLDAIVSCLRTTAVRCAALGVHYLPALVPAKRNTVKAAPTGDRSWVAELNGRLRDVDEVELLSLYPVLRHSARHGRSYQRTDAHFNDLGAFFVARALLKEAHKMVPALRPAPLQELHLRADPAHRGTLIDAPRLQWLDGALVESEQDVDPEEGTVIDASRLRARRMPVEAALGEAASTHVRVYQNPERDEDAHVAVVGGQSALPVVRWLAERARRTTFFCSHELPLSELEIELPPLVIHLIDETDLLGRPRRRSSGRPGPG